MNFDSSFDTADYRRFRVENTHPPFARKGDAALPTTADRVQQQREFRAQVEAALGNLSQWQRPDLEAQILETRDLDGYRRETIAFSTRPGLRAIGHLLIPHGVEGALPAIVCLAGHGRGARSIIGIRADGTQRSRDENEEYQADFALQCVARGYVAFAVEPMSFGDRRDEAARQSSPELSSCVRDAMAALMVGETIAGWRVWDCRRALDYLQTRDDLVDGNRLALMGISGGGMTALFTAALDERVAACVVSGYFNTFAASILSIDHCVDNYVPGLLKLCEMPDLTTLIAPRALWVESGRDDPIFPVAAFEAAVAQAREIYHAFGAPKYFGAEIFEGGHRFHGVGAFEFLKSNF